MNTEELGKGQTQRQIRVGEEIRRALATIFQRGECHAHSIHDVSITVSEVRISPDLKNATVFVMPLGGKGKETLIENLTEIAPELRRLVSSHMKMKFSPKLYFKLDTSFDEAHRIETLLKHPDVARDLNKKE